MRSRMWLAGICFLSPVVHASEPEDFITRMEHRWDQIQTYELTQKTTNKMFYPQLSPLGDSVRSFTRFEEKTVLKDSTQGTVKMRIETKWHQLGAEIAEETADNYIGRDILEVYDGLYGWLEQTIWFLDTENPYGFEVHRIRHPQIDSPYDEIKRLLREGKAQMKHKQVVKGRSCVLLELAPEGNEPDWLSASYWIEEETGLIVKSVVEGKLLKTRDRDTELLRKYSDDSFYDDHRTIEITSFRPSIPIDQSKFSYSPPADAPIHYKDAAVIPDLGIGLGTLFGAAQSYAVDHMGRFPPDLQSTRHNRRKDTPDPYEKYHNALDEAACEYIAGQTQEDHAENVLCYCRPPSDPQAIHVLFVGGNRIVVDEQELQQLLQETKKRLANR